jgi:hypothetical protein
LLDSQVGDEIAFFGVGKKFFQLCYEVVHARFR